MRKDAAMNRPTGPVVDGWTAARVPAGLHLKGQWAQLDPLDVAGDARGLWAVFEGHDHVWDYLFEEPPQDFATFEAILNDTAAQSDRFCYVIRAKDDPAPLGYACFWTVVAALGCNEIGNVNLSPAVQRTPIATEAFYLMNDWAFASGYRRMEWKCNALNRPSRQAAERLGFSYEGVFRQHAIVKGRNRDTAWYAITDGDWPALRAAYQAWLSPDNFDADGQQRMSLSSRTKPLLYQRDPTLGTAP
jgi:RimJ/RimL family protein N-acetyltransferase